MRSIRSQSPPTTKPSTASAHQPPRSHPLLTSPFVLSVVSPPAAAPFVASCLRVRSPRHPCKTSAQSLSRRTSQSGGSILLPLRRPIIPSQISHRTRHISSTQGELEAHPTLLHVPSSHPPARPPLVYRLQPASPAHEKSKKRRLARSPITSSRCQNALEF